MLQAVGRLITSRRGFLLRASAVTAAGATVAIPIITMEGARTRAEFHMGALRQALQDLYPASQFTFRHEFPEGEYADPRVMRNYPLVSVVGSGLLQGVA